ncbi:MAG: hypothetical protein KF809_14665 [Chloroflexi bacterium]|nr:hypothetical protein [Chloroflexota bacterium]
MRQIDMDNWDWWSGPPELTRDDVLVVTSHAELAGLSSSIGEALQAVDDWEFQTRVGLFPDEARRLRDQIHDIIRDRPTRG